MSNHPAFTLRNYPDDDALANPGKYSKAVSFSPEIIPLYGNTTDVNTLVDPASWRGFSGYPIVGGDVNNVYLRGYGSGGPYIANLRVFPSELILWPQVWYSVQPVASGPVMIPGGPTPGRYASDGPFQFRPPHITGSSYSLVANVVKYDEKKEYPPPPPFDLNHFGLNDFVSFLRKDETFTFYNVIVADPTVKHFSTTTRLRMFNKSLPIPLPLPVSLSFRLNWHNGTDAPEGLEASLVDDRGRIAIHRAPFGHFPKQPFMIDPLYDGILTLNVFAPPGNSNFEPYSGFSLQVLEGNSSTVLGALNVIFEPHTTRNLRFASPAAVQSRTTKEAPAEAVINSTSTTKDSSPIPVTKPAATGWWSRAGLGDTNNFPHHDQIGYSPDIQPIGTVLDKNYATILLDPATDYTNAHPVNLVGNQHNYVFLRGHSTLTDIDVQSRMFAINMTTANHPSTYLTDGFKLNVVGGKGTINEQRITVANPKYPEFYVMQNPFDFNNPPPNPQNHYCFCAELRQKRKDSPVWPGWPSDEWANYQTLADFENWIFDSPLACWRNINWQPCPPGPQQCWEWVCTTELNIPDSSSYSSFWTIIIELDNEIIPGKNQKSKWKLTSDDNSIFPDAIFFDMTEITRLDNQKKAYMGAHFTGVRPGYKANITLTVTWCDDGDKTIPPPRVNWRLALTETLISPILHLAWPSPPGHETWPFYVTKKYPYIGKDTWNPSPLPTFDNFGPQKDWPYKGALQFNLGQVTLEGKRD